MQNNNISPCAVVQGKDEPQVPIRPRAESAIRPYSIYEDPDADMVFGTIGVENIVVTTRMLGRLWGAQVLAIIKPESVSQCPQCGENVTEVAIGDHRFQCDVETRMGDSLYLCNLVAEHNHDHEDDWGVLEDQDGAE